MSQHLSIDIRALIPVTLGLAFQPMPLHPLVGHSGVRRRLIDSFQAGRLPQVILVTGPLGVGKQRLGLWIAQLLFCERRTADGPCGGCRQCRLTLDLAHSDLHWFIPIARPKAGEVGKQVEEAGELLGEALAARRAEPLYQPADGMAGHPLASARLLLRRAALTPVEGARKVFVIGEAERLVTQESSPEAANALLKLLEEPPSDTWIVLTTPEPERVLATIRSRAVPLRLARLKDEEVREFAAILRPNPEGPELDSLVRRADGIIGRIVGLSESRDKAAAEARAFLDAIQKGGSGRFERGLKQAPWSARGGFTDLLDAVALELAGRARQARSGEAARPFVLALDRVSAARTDAQSNINPQMLLASLAGELAEVL
jgi:DNA polymerase-3 subunit delta'